jgi:hypothetical protein
VILSALRRASRLSPRELLTTAHAAAALAFAEVLVRSLSLPRVCRLFGVRLDIDGGTDAGDPLRASELSTSVRRQLRCARRVTDRWRFSRGPCLRRSLVAGHLIRRERPVLRLGVTDRDGTLGAHAWLEIGGRPLENIDAYGAFARSTRRATQ